MSADNKYGASVSEDGRSRLWRLDTGASVIFATGGEEWLVYTDDGYFDSSRRGGQLVAGARGFDGFRIDQLAVRSNRPDILLERMGLGTPDLIAHYRARHELRLKRLGLDEKSLATNAGSPACPTGSPMRRRRSERSRLRRR